ncbi:MAG: hypothetical protein HUJ31_19845 [Pseudomonadales bacterium]|nr:hypothetical protein [Pseudomonadales bacterium]
MTRFGSIIIILLSLGACSWFGNDDDDCSGPGCNSAGVLDNTPSPVTWYCYGLANGTWDCQKTEDRSRIAPTRSQTDLQSSADTREVR